MFLFYILLKTTLSCYRHLFCFPLLCAYQQFVRMPYYKGETLEIDETFQRLTVYLQQYIALPQPGFILVAARNNKPNSHFFLPRHIGNGVAFVVNFYTITPVIRRKYDFTAEPVNRNGAVFQYVCSYPARPLRSRSNFRNATSSSCSVPIFPIETCPLTRCSTCAFTCLLL